MTFRKVLILCLLFKPVSAFSWSDVGHEVVAKIAWSQLNEPTKAKVTALLKELSTHYTQANSIATASKIPDAMSSGISAFNSWHYVNIPYAPFNMTVPQPGSVNILTGLCEC